MFPPNDMEFEDKILEKVEDKGSGYTLRVDGGMDIFVQNPLPIEPKKGMICRFYGKGFGYPVRGIFIEGRKVYYRTKEQERARYKRWVEEKEKKWQEDFENRKEEYDRRFNALPILLKKRIIKFREHNSEFRWKFEFYELFCCEQAIAIANGVQKAGKDHTFFEKKSEKKSSEWDNIPFETKRELVPELSDGHSGNTFGISSKLAYYLMSRPEMVVWEHGALVPLVGCEEYGCPTGEKAKTYIAKLLERKL